jgi:predicted nucleic acid-binding protein
VSPAQLGPVYLDASALAKLYSPEAGSRELNRALAGRRDLLLSDLAITEVVSALARRRREGTLTARTAQLVHRTLLAHLETGIYQRLDLVPATHRDAERLLLGAAEPLRAGDALHLAAALAAGAATVVTFDRRLGRAAAEAGLQVFPRQEGGAD